MLPVSVSHIHARRPAVAHAGADSFCLFAVQGIVHARGHCAAALVIRPRAVLRASHPFLRAWREGVPMKEPIHYVTDERGNIVAVQLPLALWERLRPALAAEGEDTSDAGAPLPEPMDGFADFLRYWDFRYPYDPAVRCPHCGVHVEDWRTAPGHPFHLANANLGGLLVFHCRSCGATIRQKHFRDHVALESTPRS